MGEALGSAGVSIEGGGAWVVGGTGTGVGHFLFAGGTAAGHSHSCLPPEGTVTDREDIREEPLDRIAGQVRERYRAAWGASLIPLGNRGGFSGAALWRGEGANGRFCLRAWPARRNTEGIRRLHRLMEHAGARGLDFVPAVYAVDQGDTVVETAGRVWEMTQWLDGRADFAEHPSTARLEAACAAVAQLHRAWEAFTTPPEPCPAVRRRRKVLADWQALVTSGWRPLSLTKPDPVWPIAERAWRMLPGWLPDVARSLVAWGEFRRPTQPCLRDVWHDHLLFEADRLVGLVDYGEVRADHVTVDLARLLGSLVGDDLQGWECGLRAYRRVRGLDENEARLAGVLDRAGTVLGVVNWLRWLYHEGRPYEDLPAVARRLESLLRRIEGWPR